MAANRTFYTWIAYADDNKGNGISLNPDGKKYIGTAANRTTKTPDLSDATIYSWMLAKGDDAVTLHID